MGRIFILGAIIWNSITFYGQNLVLNPDFEEIVQHHGDLRIYLDTFYAKHWFTPTAGSVDIYRNKLLLNIPNFNLDAHTPFNMEVFSGSYCIGLFFLEFMGQMEHITGTLSHPLITGQSYRVSFYIKMHSTPTPFIPKGMGYKFSQDSIVFKTDEFDERGKYSPFYDHLFKQNKVYADYEIDEYILDTTWVKYTSIYKAKGGERYITLGRFAYKRDKNIVRQFKKLRYAPWKDKMLKFVKSDQSKVCKRFFDKKRVFDIEGSNYYYIDLVEVVPLDTFISIPDATKNKINDEANLGKGYTPEDAYHYVDLDPSTTIPSKKEITIDKGFEGEIKLELGVRIKPMEMYVLEYDKNRQIIIVNTGNYEGFSEMIYNFKYPAKKLRKKPVRFYVERTNSGEIETLKLNAKSVEEFSKPNFKGIIIKRKN